MKFASGKEINHVLLRSAYACEYIRQTDIHTPVNKVLGDKRFYKIVLDILIFIKAREVLPLETEYVLERL